MGLTPMLVTTRTMRHATLAPPGAVRRVVVVEVNTSKETYGLNESVRTGADWRAT